MKILFLCNKSPWPPREGGPMAMNMIVEGLAAMGHQIKVIAVNSFKYNISKEDIPHAYLQKTSIELIDLDLRVKPLPALFNLFTGRSYHVERFISEPFRNTIIRALREEEYDVVQLEMLFMAPYIETIREHSKAKIVLRAHNIEHLIWQRIASETKNPLKRWYIGHLARTLRNYELKTIPLLDGIVAITPNDAGYFRKILDNSTVKGIPVIDLPFGIKIPEIPVSAGPDHDPTLFSIGSMNWIPNQEGIRWFLDQVWPDVHRQFPRLKYVLAGREMPPWMKELDIPNVVVTGEVPDSGSFMASHTIMIVPLFSGSGIRIKIIEGMAAGKTIISTTTGAEGINYTDRENILIANRPCEFFEMISICINDPGLRSRIGNQARSLIETSYDPDILMKKLVAFYRDLSH